MTSQNRTLTIVVDDTSKDEFTFGGPASWTTSNAPQWFNESAQTPAFALNNSRKFGSTVLQFIGTSAAFVGVTPPPFTDSQIFTVAIDDLAPYNTTYGDPNPPSYRQWFTTPTLADGKHSVTLTRVAGATVDYAVVAAGSGTPLLNHRAIVDNDDSSGVLAYTGKWRRSSEQFNSGPGADGLPHQNTTHQTSYIGDSMTFRFTGKAAAVYGIFTWSNIGVVSLNFTLDGTSMIRKYQVTVDSPQFTSELGQQPNFLFQSYDFLEPGDHNLTASVVECTNQTFIFDYMLYQPTFATIGNMPHLVVQPGGPSTTPTSSAGIPVGIIIGACIGTALFMALLALSIHYFRRRSKNTNGPSRSKGRKYAPIQPFIHRDHDTLQQPSPRPMAFGSYEAEAFELHPPPPGIYNDAASSHISLSTYHYAPHSPSLSTHDTSYGGDVLQNQQNHGIDPGDLSNALPPPSYEEISSDQPHHVEANEYFARRA